MHVVAYERATWRYTGLLANLVQHGIGLAFAGQRHACGLMIQLDRIPQQRLPLVTGLHQLAACGQTVVVRALLLLCAPQRAIGLKPLTVNHTYSHDTPSDAAVLTVAVSDGVLRYRLRLTRSSLGGVHIPRVTCTVVYKRWDI